MRDVSLWSFLYAHFQVYGVSHHIDFNRLQVIEQIAIVPVSVANSILILSQTLIEQLLVIHVTFSHAEQGGKVVGTVHRITHPCDVTHIVFLSLVELEIYVNVLLVIGSNAVFQYDSITITQFIILVEQVLLIL